MRGEKSQETGDSISKSSSNSCSGSNEGLCGAGWIGCQCIVYAKDQNSIEFLGWILRVSLGGFSDLAIPFWGEVGWGCSTLGTSEQFGGLWKTVATLEGDMIYTCTISFSNWCTKCWQETSHVQSLMPFTWKDSCQPRIPTSLEPWDFVSDSGLMNLQDLLHGVQSFKHVDRYLGIIYRKKENYVNYCTFIVYEIFSIFPWT